MKKTLLCALAILLACAFAVPASAQSRRRHGRSDGHYGYQYGYTGTALEAVTIRNMGMIEGLFGELEFGRSDYGYRDRYYDRHYNNRRRPRISRDELFGSAAIVGGAWAINRIANRHGDDNGDEKPSKCFERVVKNARKQRLELDASEAMAFCNGQPLREPPQTVTPLPDPVMPSAPRGVFVEHGRLCNDTEWPLTVLVDGRAVGVIAPGEFVTLSRLPVGQVTYRHERGLK